MILTDDSKGKEHYLILFISFIGHPMIRIAVSPSINVIIHPVILTTESLFINIIIHPVIRTPAPPAINFIFHPVNRLAVSPSINVTTRPRDPTCYIISRNTIPLLANQRCLYAARRRRAASASVQHVCHCHPGNVRQTKPKQSTGDCFQSIH